MRSLFRLAANSYRHEAIAGKLIRSWSGLDKKIHSNIFHALSIFHRFHSNSSQKVNQEGGTLSPPASNRRLLSSAVEKDGDDNLRKKSIVRDLLNKYGAVAVGTYFCVWVMTFTSVFICLDFDIFNAATFGLDPAAAVLKVCDLIEKYTGSSDLPTYVRENPRVGTLVIAFVMTKLTEPVRIMSTLTLVPIIAKWFQKNTTDKPK